MAQSFKVCPICGSLNHRNAGMCNTCGTSLTEVGVSSNETSDNAARQLNYDFHFGETDLFEGSLNSKARKYLVTVVTLLIIAFAGASVYSISSLMRVLNSRPAPEVPIEGIAVRPTLDMVTVTQGPPTETATGTPPPTFTPSSTPTPTPCVQRVVAGDSLISIIVRCGHVDRDVIPTVLALNNIESESFIRAGQDIVVPWPTPTLDPNATAETEVTEEVSASSSNPLNVLLPIADQSEDVFGPTATATLPPGVMWHVVEQDENIITIAIEYNANAKILSELNPEIDFARCEFGERFGGPQCLVQLSQGQQLRVPAPTPTPTLSPTPSGSETPTPTATPTFNEPNAISPSDRTFFNRSELVTLRWVPTGTLTTGEVYRVTVTDKTVGTTYTAETQSISFIIPQDWQGMTSARHEFEWTVGVVDTSNPEAEKHTTAPLTFVWEGLDTINQ